MKMKQFDKNLFVFNTNKALGRIGLSVDEFCDQVEVPSRSMSNYLNVDEPNLPKLPTFVRWFQVLMTSPGRLLINKGPEFLDSSGEEKMFRLLDLYGDPTRPDFRLIVLMLLELADREVTIIRKMLATYCNENNLLIRRK